MRQTTTQVVGFARFLLLRGGGSMHPHFGIAPPGQQIAGGTSDG